MDRVDWSPGTGDSKTSEESEIVAIPLRRKNSNEVFCGLDESKSVEVLLKKRQNCVSVRQGGISQAETRSCRGGAKVSK